MNSAMRWQPPDYGAFETVSDDADAEATLSLLLAALRL